jgi:AcrR family transcriptional regulator
MTFLLVFLNATLGYPLFQFGGRGALFFETHARLVSSYLRQKELFRLTAMETRSKDYIIDAFFALLSEHDYYAIDVTKISKKAGVSRATFYRNFQSKEEIIKAYFERSEIEFLSAHSALNPYSDPREFVYYCFEKLGKEKANLLALYHQGLIHYLSEALNAGIEKDFADHERGDKAAAYLYAGAVYNLEVYDLANGAVETPANLTQEFLHFLRYENN